MGSAVEYCGVSGSVCACVMCSMSTRARRICVAVRSLVQPCLNLNLLQPLPFFEILTLPGVFSKALRACSGRAVFESWKRSESGEAVEQERPPGTVAGSGLEELGAGEEPAGQELRFGQGRRAVSTLQNGLQEAMGEKAVEAASEENGPDVDVGETD